MNPASSPHDLHEVVVTVNGVTRSARVPARRLLSDMLRHDLRLTGTHVGCEHGVCGACTVLLEGEPIRSCLTFAVMVDGARITTVEGLAGPDGELGPVQRAFRECHGLQCGFCTPGFLLLTTELLARMPGTRRRRDHPCPRGQPLPLHRLRQHRPVGAAGLGAGEGAAVVTVHPRGLRPRAPSSPGPRKALRGRVVMGCAHDHSLVR